MRKIHAIVLICIAVAVLGGCAQPPPVSPPVGPPSTSVTPSSEASTPPVVEQVVVPNVLGMYSDKAAEAIDGAGLEAVEKSLYGPQDEDAGEPGVVYRQTPAAGTKVAPGTKVEIRYWYETQ